MAVRSASKLRDFVSVVSPHSADRFVGLRVTSKGPELVFPLGYSIPQSEVELRTDARALLQLIAGFEHSINLESQYVDSSTDVPTNTFVLRSFMILIEDYLRTGEILTETSHRHVNSAEGQIDWLRTIATKRPFVNARHVVYMDLVSRRSKERPDSLVRIAHEIALVRSFEQVGWLYPETNFNVDTRVQANFDVIAAVRQRIRHTFHDRQIMLLQAVLSVLTFSAPDEGQQTNVYGTNTFEVMWESLVDKSFGDLDGKRMNYYPRTSWLLGDNQTHSNPLLPDTIMSLGGATFVLDAKYYRYGISKDPRHLPGSSDIAKQIVYGDQAMVAAPDNFRVNVFNAFILPRGSKSPDAPWCEVVGESRVSWRPEPKDRETIVVVLVDTRILLRNYESSKTTLKESLANCISSYFNSRTSISANRELPS